MKKKLIILVVFLLLVGASAWAVYNQIKPKTDLSNLNKTQQPDKNSTPPGDQIALNPETDSSSSGKASSSTKHPRKNDKHTNQSKKSNNRYGNRPNSSNSNNPQPSNPNNNSNTNPNPSNPGPTSPNQPNPNPDNPSQPPTPPTPPQPPVDPAQQIISQLKSPLNDNVAQFTNDTNQIRTVLWTKGITGPRLGAGGDFKRVEEIHGGQQFITYATGYRNEFLAAGWYDTDKTHGSSSVDRLLCFGAVAANQLHWWMNYHKDRVEQFIVKTNYRNNLPPSQQGTFKDLTTYQNSFKGQQNSRFFKMISLYFGNNSEGYYADPLIDMFINGHKPKPGGGSNDPDWPHNFQMDSRGGFFHEVFGKRNLTRRLVPSDFNDFTNEMKKAFRDGESVGIIHHTSPQNTHIVTAWGLEYDLDGQLVAVYITDSDDQDDTKTGGMKRYNIKNVNNRAVMSTNVTNPKAGSLVDRISTLGLGDAKWNEFLN